MYDLSNLNDFEFEILCKDIIQKKLNTKLYTFSRGKDGGIDICDGDKNLRVVVQVKHYLKSTYGQLKTSLKKEKDRMDKLNPKTYYICTSLELTKNNKDEIVEIFSTVMPDISYIFDKTEINDFLGSEENIDIVKKNHKLWLCATNILGIINNQNAFIDSYELIIDIEDSINFFVDTSSYFEAKQKLIENKFVIITGAPGVGKSTISKMLVLHFAKDGYSVRYVTDNNIADIKKILSTDNSKKEIILIDDFLGQHYLKIKDSQPNELKTLIAFVEKSLNKKLILNSRITILNEAIQSSITFKELMNKKDNTKYLIDLDKMSLLEKARILYNHLFFNDLPDKYFGNIKLNENYLKIIRHKNYNPRIVDYATKSSNFQDVNPNDYFQYFMGKLDKPKDVWKDEFNNRVNETDRILMNTLYSLSDVYIDDKYLEKAFNKRVREVNKIDTSKNIYNETKIRLTNSLLKTNFDKNIMKISTVNPSVNDYLCSAINDNPNEQIEIIKTAICITQILKVARSSETDEIIKNMILSGDLLKLDVIQYSIYYYYLKLIIKYEIFNSNIKNNVSLSLEQAYTNLSYLNVEEYGDIIYTLLIKKYFDFYCLDRVFKNYEKLNNILKPINLDTLRKIFDAYEKYSLGEEVANDYYEIIYIFKKLFVDKIFDLIEEEIEEDLQEIISRNLSIVDTSYIDDYKLDTDNDRIIGIMWENIVEIIYEKIDDKIYLLNPLLVIDDKDFDIKNMRYYFDIDGAVNANLQDEPDYDDDYRNNNSVGNELNDIKNMFERK